MARALRAWAINRGGKNSVRNLRYGPRTRLVRGIDWNFSVNSYEKWVEKALKSPIFNCFSFIAESRSLVSRWTESLSKYLLSDLLENY